MPDACQCIRNLILARTMRKFNVANTFMKKSYVMIHVIKHDMDPNSNINQRRKIAPMKEKSHQKPYTGVPRFTLLMWGHKRKTAETKTAEIEVTQQY